MITKACKTDKIDSMVLAVLSHRDVVPAIWLPTRGSEKSASSPAFAYTSSTQDDDDTVALGTCAQRIVGGNGALPGRPVF